MVKDLKYLAPTSFLIGWDPQDPECDLNKENIILYGDCAIKSTKKREFKVIKKESKKKIKVKPNPRVLEFSGCPPDIFSSLEKMVAHFGKSEVPTLSLFCDTVKSYIFRYDRENLDRWEDL